MSRLTETFIVNEAQNQVELEFTRVKSQVDRAMMKLASEMKGAPPDKAASAANFAATDIKLILTQMAQRILSSGGNK